MIEIVIRNFENIPDENDLQECVDKGLRLITILHGEFPGVDGYGNEIRRIQYRAYFEKLQGTMTVIAC